MQGRCLFHFHSNIAPSLNSKLPILQGRIHGTELPELGLGHNFRLGWSSDLKKAFLNCILKALSDIPHLPDFGDVPGARCFVQEYRKVGKWGIPEKGSQNVV